MNKGVEKFRRRIKEVFGFDIALTTQKKGTNTVLCKKDITILNVLTVAQVRKRIRMIKDGLDGYEEYMNNVLIYKGLPCNLSDIHLGVFLDNLCGLDPHMRLSDVPDYEFVGI